MTARAFLGPESLTTDEHGWTRIIEPLPVLIRVHPWLIHLNYGPAALSFLRLSAANCVALVVRLPSNQRLE